VRKIYSSVDAKEVVTEVKRVGTTGDSFWLPADRVGDRGGDLKEEGRMRMIETR